MSRWSWNELSNGVDLKRGMTGCVLGFLVSLGFDRGVYAGFTMRERLGWLALATSSFPISADYPLTCLLYMSPAVYILRKRLLKPGGGSLLCAIGFAALFLSDRFPLVRSRRKRRESDTSIRILDFVAIPHQILSWYFIPHFDGIWGFISGLFNNGRFKWWLWMSSTCLAGWCVYPTIMNHLRIFNPGTYSMLSYYLYEKPTYFIQTALRDLQTHASRVVSRLHSGALKPYQYKPLDPAVSEIRLLRLSPSDRWGLVKCQLITVPISDTPPFEAISYRWTSGGEVPILLDEGMFMVSGPLHTMLRYLQYPLEERTLWIDALCINQTDIGEKDWQIGMMSRIYRSADRIIGWLGIAHQSDTGFASAKFSDLREIARQLEDDDISGEDMAGNVLSGEYYTKLRSVPILFWNEFFFRVWIIQEVSLAKTVILKLGEEEIEWKTDQENRRSDGFVNAAAAFALISSYMMAMMPLPSNVVSRAIQGIANAVDMDSLRISLADHPDGLPLNEALIAVIDFECTDKRDRIYGLLGLSTEEARTTLGFDHSHLNQEVHVSIRATRFTLTAESSFSLLELAGIGYHESLHNRPTERPSWVPRWDDFHITKTKDIHVRARLYETASYSQSKVTCEENDVGVIRIEGSCVDHINIVSSIWYPWGYLVKAPMWNNEEAVVQMTSLLELVEVLCTEARRLKAEHGYEDRRNPIWRTLFHDSSKMRDLESTYFEECSNGIQQAILEMRTLLHVDYERDQVDIAKISGHMNSFARRMPSVFGRRICVTEHGRLGIVPPFLQPGDQIWAFSGAPNPFVLRPDEVSSESKSERNYRLVGACYIEGIMLGELKETNPMLEMISLI